MFDLGKPRGLVGGCLLLCVIVYAARQSVLLALADYQFTENTPSSLHTAVRLMPGNASYHELYGEHVESTTADAAAEFRKAQALSPRESRFLIRLAFRSEVDGNFQQAEKYLAQAVEVDRGFEPRSAFMNYYFRRSNPEKFWHWARLAMEKDWTSFDPIFRLCWLTTPDAMAIRRSFPEHPGILREFLIFLLRTQPVEKSAPIAIELAERAESADVQPLIQFVDRAIEKRTLDSKTVWNDLCKRHLLPFSETGSVEFVTNNSFLVTPSRGGFDWKYGRNDEFQIYRSDRANALTVEASGKEPELFQLLSQTIPLWPGRDYTLHYEYRFAESGPLADLRWHVLGLGDDLGVASAPLTATSWTAGEWRFHSGADSLSSLSLDYQRVRGTPLWRGSLFLKSVSITESR